ncbi:MAG: sigma-70 family RNA polymerase sigma factor [Planctomycetota bacterium]
MNVRDNGTEELRDRFERLALCHIPAIYRLALSLAHDPEDAEDLLQETYLRAFRSFRTFREGTNCRAWLLRICRNHFFDLCRHRRRRPRRESIDGVQPAAPEEMPGAGPDDERPQDTAVGGSEHLSDEVNTALSELCEEFRVSLLLCDLLGLKYNEIAETLRVPLGTVRSRISRARAVLRQRLEPFARAHGFWKPDASTVPAAPQRA